MPIDFLHRHADVLQKMQLFVTKQLHTYVAKKNIGHKDVIYGSTFRLSFHKSQTCVKFLKSSSNAVFFCDSGMQI